MQLCLRSKYNECVIITLKMDVKVELPKEVVWDNEQFKEEILQPHNLGNQHRSVWNIQQGGILIAIIAFFKLLNEMCECFTLSFNVNDQYVVSIILSLLATLCDD